MQPNNHKNNKRALKTILRSSALLLLVLTLFLRQTQDGPRKLQNFIKDTAVSIAATSSEKHPPKQKKRVVSVPYSTKYDRDGVVSQPKVHPSTVVQVAAAEPLPQKQNQLQTHTKIQPQVQRSQRQRKKQTIDLNNVDTDALGLPPLNSLIGDLHQNVTGDVQFLLDFAIVGFGKCGTTALIDWLDAHPEINTIEKEALHLSRHRPALMVQKLYQMKVESLLLPEAVTKANITTTINNNMLQGFKNPSDVRRPESMAYLRQYWPQTKLIITVRHPVRWFQSLYNFLLHEMGRSQKFLHGHPLIGGPHKNTAYAHTGKGEFHAILSLLGKTEMVEEEELELLKGFLREEEIQDWPLRLPNKIFFLDTLQMADTNETRAALFRKDLQDFLGLKRELPPVPHVRPGKERKAANHDDFKKIDICRPENEELRQELMRISEKASLWIRKYFLNSPDVIVSSRNYLEEIFATTWLQDPCTVDAA